MHKEDAIRFKYAAAASRVYRYVRKKRRSWNTLLQDLRFSIRELMKSPGFSFVAILTLALGIGANAAIFSIVNAVLLQPFAFKAPEKLAWIYSQPADRPRLSSVTEQRTR